LRPLHRVQKKAPEVLWRLLRQLMRQRGQPGPRRGGVPRRRVRQHLLGPLRRWMNRAGVAPPGWLRSRRQITGRRACSVWRRRGVLVPLQMRREARRTRRGPRWTT